MQSKSINQDFTEDHQHLQALFRRFQSMKATNRPGAREVFEEFKSELERHILWEERILFPWFDQKCGNLNFSPIPSLHREHEQILVCLDDITQKLVREDLSSDDEEKDLERALCLHNEKEEQELFPALDESLTDQERTAVFAAMSERR